MDSNKRNFLTLMIPAAFAVPFVSFATLGTASAQRATHPVPLPSTASGGTEIPSGGDLKLDPKKILQKNQEQIHDNVEKIYVLAGELKNEMEKTDSANVLSLTIMQKAEQIEKLAKQVKNLARGD